MRPIDADELKKQAYPFPCAIGVEHAVTLRAVNDAPTVDAVAVVRAEWQEESHSLTCVDMFCTNCFHSVTLQKVKPNYKFCPNCGAKMERGDKD